MRIFKLTRLRNITSSFLKVSALTLHLPLVFSLACTIENVDKNTDKIFISNENGKLKLFKQVNPLVLNSCKEEVQLALSVVLPSPQDYSSEYWMHDSISNKKTCEITSDLKFLKEQKEVTSEVLFKKFKIFESCVGLRVKDLDQKKIRLSKSVNCEVLPSSTESELLLKGDNCFVRTTSKAQNLVVSPLVLDSCADIKDFIDFNANLKVIKIENKIPEILTSKDYHILFEDKEEPRGKIKVKEGMLPFFKSSHYMLDYYFFNLIFNGSKDLTLNVQAQYFVNNFSNQHLPFVVKNDLTLVKKTSKVKIPLGLWYNGIIVPGQWMGVDGLSDNLSITHSVESYQLSQNAKQIEKGDFLILSGQLVSPNTGYQKFWKFTHEYLKKMAGDNRKRKPGKVQSRVISDEIPPIDELKSFSQISQIEEFSLEQATKKIFNLDPRFQIRFTHVCQKPNREDLECEDLSVVEDLPEIKVLFEVTDSEYEIKVKPIKIIKTNWNQKKEEENLNSSSSILCH